MTGPLAPVLRLRFAIKSPGAGRGVAVVCVRVVVAGHCGCRCCELLVFLFCGMSEYANGEEDAAENQQVGCPHVMEIEY